MKKIQPPRLGISLLLMLFTVLLLAILGMLTLSQGLSQQRLSEAAARSVAEYYRAEGEAQEIFSLLRRGEIPPQVTVSGDTYTYACPISAHRTLHVTLLRGDGGWEVLRWQEVAHPEELTENLPVWQGGEP